MSALSVHNISARFKSSAANWKPKFDDIINITDDDDLEPVPIRPESHKRQLSPSSATPSTKRRSTSNEDSDLEIISHSVIRSEDGPQQRTIRAHEHSYDSIPPAPKNLFKKIIDENAYANVLVKPQIQLSRTTTPVNLDGGALRAQFEQNLKTLQGPRVKVFNNVDNTSPPSNFVFINENVLGAGVVALSKDFMTGCSCKKDNGRHMGCEFIKCECVQQSDPNEKGLRYFPYSAATVDRGCLRGVYLSLRNHIYECNDFCNCDNDCKNRLVQHGRQVPLEIFKTKNRGWGLRCPDTLLKGQFIDTYRGEVITNEESNRRGTIRARDHDADNYLFGLDKFCQPRTITSAEFKALHPKKKQWHRNLVQNGEYVITVNKEGKKMYLNPDYEPPKYDIDSKEMGGPSRFINHSCSPNCAIYTVSYNHADIYLYEVAFFATETIPAGTELTFDYKDDEDTEKITDAMADKIEQETGERPTKCLCGTEECRGYFFH